MARSSAVAPGWRYYVIDGLHRSGRRRLGLDLRGVPLNGGTWAGLADFFQPTLE